MAKSDKDYSVLADFCIDRFSQGRAAMIVRGERKLFFIPEALADEGGGNGLIIVWEGGGSYVYRPGTNFNEYLLVTAGLPLMIAKAVADLIAAILAQYARTEGAGNELFLITNTRSQNEQA